MPRISGSEAMVEALRKENVEYVMGIVGSAFMDPLDLFPEAGIRFIQVRHEQSASLMAEGYARITGRPGVCIGQNGPGITNLVTGIASAQLNHSPVVALTPAVIASGIGTKAFQEIDQMRLLAPIVAWQLQVNRPERMSEGIRGAFRAALALRGPAQVDIPRDSYYAEWEETPLDPPSYRTAGRLGGADEEDLQRAVQAITGAKKIAILAGLGAVESDAQADIDRLAELLNSPVATVWQHNDAIFNSRPLSTGSIGYQGSQAAMRLVADADVVIALGTRLNAFGTTPQWGLDFWPKSAKLIHNSMNPLDIGALRPVHAGLVGDCRAVVRQLIAALQDQPLAVDGAARRAQVAQEKQRWAAALREMSAIGGDKIQPRRAMWEISQALQGDVAIVADVGNISGSANAYFDRFDTSRRWFGAGSLGGIGVSYPTALGVKLGRPDLPVVALVGDGAWSMTMQEVMTAVRERLNVCAVILNNQVYGAERRNQYDFFGERYFFTDLQNPSFADIARHMGAYAVSVDKAEDIGPAITAALKVDRPSVVEVHIDPGVLNEPYRRDALKMPMRVTDKYRKYAAPGPQ
jgi:sulfoacetaldehyde acetyltransferase